MERTISHPYEIGKNYLIRTVTMIYTGRLLEVYDHELVIDKACWIPQTERWNESVDKCIFREQEPYGKDRKVILGRGAILDACIPGGELPKVAK